jgi:Rad3-related DNA helicase
MYHKDADIILIAYKYLLNFDMRRSLDIQLKNSIIIVDEAHNIMQAAEEIIEYDIKNSDI